MRRSERVGTQDFGTARPKLADITRHLPCALAHVEGALAEAQINTATWQARLLRDQA